MATPVHFNPFINFELYKPVEAELQSDLERVQTLSQNNEWYANWGGRFVCIAYPTAIILLIAFVVLPVLSFPLEGAAVMISLAGLASAIDRDLKGKNRELIREKSAYIIKAATKMMKKVDPYGEIDRLSFSAAKERAIKIQEITQAAYLALNPLVQKSTEATAQKITEWMVVQDRLVTYLTESDLQKTYPSLVNHTLKLNAKSEDFAQTQLIGLIRIAQVYCQRIFARALPDQK